MPAGTRLEVIKSAIVDVIKKQFNLKDIEVSTPVAAPAPAPQAKEAKQEVVQVGVAEPKEEAPAPKEGFIYHIEETKAEEALKDTAEGQTKIVETSPISEAKVLKVYTDVPHTQAEIEAFKNAQVAQQEKQEMDKALSHVDFKNRIAIDLAWMVGGVIVFGGSTYAINKLDATYSAIAPIIDRAARRRLQKALAKTHVAKLAETQPALSRTARKSLAKEIALKKSPRAGALRKTVPKIARYAARAGMFIGSAMALWGTIELVGDILTGELSDAELSPQDHMEELKRSIYTLEKNPSDLHLQDRLIGSLMAALPGVSQSLKIQYNEEFLYVEELKSLTTVSAEDKEKAEKEFQTFAQEIDPEIAFLEETSRTLYDVFGAEVRRSDPEKAQEILQARIPHLEKILGSK